MNGLDSLLGYGAEIPDRDAGAGLLEALMASQTSPAQGTGEMLQDPFPREASVKGKDKGKGKESDTLTNIRIPAGTNPTFKANTTINGVIYIESPNIVTFKGNTTICGVIVAEQPEIENLSANQIHFEGNVTSSGVENLPAGREFDGLRELTGSFLLAPGFSTRFKGKSNMLSGWTVASSFDFSGNGNAKIRGGVMNLNDSNFLVGGNRTMTIDKASVAAQPAGMVATHVLTCVPGSYEE